MFINFNFKNYMSFRDKCEFTMKATSDKSHIDNIFDDGKDKVSFVKIIYGANASGKTSFIKAVDFIRIFAALSNNLIEKAPIGVDPYVFRKNYANELSEFSIEFKKDRLKYAYSFSCTASKVVNEKLDIYYSAKATNIFTRTNTNDYAFTKDSKILNELKVKNTENKLFLVTTATWNYEKTKPVVDYILNDIVVLYDTAQPLKYNLDYISKNNEMEEYKKFCLKFLNNADLSITDFDIDMKKFKDLKDVEMFTNITKLISNNNEDAVNKLINTNVFNIKTAHNISDGTTNEKYFLELQRESLGTIQMFQLAPALYYIFKEGKTLFIDEIDRSLHPLLVEYIIKMFLDKDINIHNAQLICNTHDTNLLNLEIFRRDEIMFTERDPKTGATELFPLSDFSPRNNENIEKSYLLGRFGAIPFIKGE